jgi:hypothetical protein
MLKSIMLTAVAVLFVTPAMAQMTTPSKPAPAKPGPEKPAAAKVATTNVATKNVVTKKATTVTRTPAKQRTAKSLACSKDADAKKLHGAPREKFMRDCNKPA